MKISERCRDTIDKLTDARNNMKKNGETEPYGFCMWDIDFESISELYLAYNSTINQLEDITELYHRVNDYIADFEESEDRCATLEAENNRFRNTIKNMKENFTEHLNALESENHDLKKQIEDVKKQTYDMYSHKLVKLQFLESENHDLKDSLENKEQVIDGLNKECRSLHNTINILRADNSNQSHEIHKLKTENERLREKVDELHTIKKSFEVLRALYLGDYEDDEPF